MRKILKYVFEPDPGRTISFAMPAARRLLCINPNPAQPTKPAMWFEVDCDDKNATTEVVEFLLVKSGEQFYGVEHGVLEYRGSAMCGLNLGGFDLSAGEWHVYEVVKK